ncbi:DNA polymerase III subunit delta' [Candidatus Omnitrophota bacterium]
MLLLSDIKGQSNAVRHLSNSLSLGRIANGYLFSGPRGVGRVKSAKAFIMALVCQNAPGQVEACGQCPSCRKINDLQHPDVLWVKPEKKKTRTIKIDEIRKAKGVLNLKPFTSPVSVCVIEDAHVMTPEASNALLKVLEEPPGSALLILITHKKELLFETVVSRCAEVRFHSLSVKDTKDIIMQEAADIDEEAAYFLAYFSQGSPGRALEMIEEGLLQRKDVLYGMVEEIVKEERASCLNWDSDDRDILLEDLEMLIMLLRDIALGKEALNEMILDKDITGTEMYKFFERYPTEKIYGIMERLIKVKLALTGNVNPKLVAQVLPGMIK